MGTLALPIAASGVTAPVTLVEVKTNYVPPGSGGGGGGGTLTPLPPPFALAPGHTGGWALPTSVGAINSAGGIASGTPATMSAQAGGSMSFFASAPLAGWYNAVQWSNFSFFPVPVPAGAVIHGIYPVVIASNTYDRAFHYWSYGPDGTITHTNAGNGFSLPAPPNPTGSFASAEFYDVSIGTSLSALAGQFIRVMLNQSLSLTGMMDNITVTGVGFFIDYTAGPPSLTLGIGAANSQLATGTYFWSEHYAQWPSVIQGGAIAQFLDFLMGSQLLHIFGSTQTDTATITVQNTSGDTVNRDISKAFTEQEFIGALVVIRVWRGDAENALLTFIGNVKTVDLNEDRMVLNIEGLGNWSAVAAPAYNIDPACPLTFASKACGSTSSTPCDQTYGTCSSINRFAGVLVGWVSETPNEQLAQPAPNVIFNPARPF